MRKTKTFWTIGPASSSEEVFAEMGRAGLNGARLNFSHGTHEEHQQKFDMIRKVRRELELPIAIMLCQAAGINPLAGASSVSVCAAGAFVTPFGTAPNLLVWEAGGYSVKDYLKCGFPMLIIFGVVTTALCAVFYL